MLATHMLRLSRLGLLVCAASALAATGGPSRPDAALSQAKAALGREHGLGAGREAGDRK